jgi:acetylornithine/succinyldiaminopimelate/putrescine aminotransferase
MPASSAVQTTTFAAWLTQSGGHSTTGTNPIAVLMAGSNVVNTVTSAAIMSRASDCRV